MYGELITHALQDRNNLQQLLMRNGLLEVVIARNNVHSQSITSHFSCCNLNFYPSQSQLFTYAIACLLNGSHGWTTVTWP